MTIKEAMYDRHMVRKYNDKEIPHDLIKKLNERITRLNEEYGLSIKLITNNNKGINIIARLILAKGVRNYFILAGDKSDDLVEIIGYCGADLMLYAQTLGLNTWYIGGMFNKGVSKFVKGKHPIGVIAVGYGQTQGTLHKMKEVNEVSNYKGEMPEWFLEGIKASLYAPTAFGKLDYVIMGEENKVLIKNNNGVFTGVNRGLIKYHFELGAGKENFEWVE